MKKPILIPDVLLNYAVGFAAIAVMMLFGWGFVARAGDSPAEPWWIAGALCAIPPAYILWLCHTGAVKVISAEKLEARAIQRLPPLPARVMLALALLVLVAQMICYVLDFMSIVLPERQKMLASIVGSMITARMAGVAGGLAVLGLVLWLPAVWRELEEEGKE